MINEINDIDKVEIDNKCGISVFFSDGRELFLTRTILDSLVNLENTKFVCIHHEISSHIFEMEGKKRLKNKGVKHGI